MSVSLLPHTPEWFAELRRANPQQASHTARIVELAGNEQVCSICGDTPAEDCSVPGSRLLARLCRDCKKIQGGQRWSPPPAR